MKLLIKDTTREERERIVAMSLSGCGGSCENCPSCGIGGGLVDDMYQDYIDGKREIAEINAAFRAPLVRG